MDALYRLSYNGLAIYDLRLMISDSVGIWNLKFAINFLGTHKLND
jgi:hypothetical protein